MALSRFGTITQVGDSTLDVPTRSTTHTLEATGTGNVLLLVGTVVWFAEEVTGVTWDGLAMTKAVSTVRGLHAHVAFWYLLNPASTDLQTIVLTTLTN